MQLTHLLETAKWIESLYSTEVKQFILGGTGFWDFIHDSPRTGAADAKLVTVFRVTHELAIVGEKLSDHPLAPEVLRAFNLELLLDRMFPVLLAQGLAGPGSGQVSELGEKCGVVLRQWRVLSGFITPVETLTIPKSVIQEQKFDEVLTIEVRYADGVNPQVKAVSDLLTHVTKLYEAVCRAGGYGEYSSLVLIYQASGSSVRFDLKGLGEPIKQIKQFFVEVWTLIRHRRADDFHHNGKAIVEGLNILDRIEKSQRSSALSGEEANRLRLQINRAMLGLLQSGALTREVDEFEVVHNIELMQGIQQRLLPAAPQTEEKDERAKEAGQTKTSKRRKRTKRKIRSTEVSEAPSLPSREAD